MQTSTQFSLTQSGQIFSVPNSILNSSTLTVTFNGSDPTEGYSISVEGFSNASGTSVWLNTFQGSGYSGNVSINLSGVAYDAFRFVPSWTGAFQHFSVAVECMATGAGSAFAANLNLANVHTQ